jgi:hypothetical protein
MSSNSWLRGSFRAGGIQIIILGEEMVFSALGAEQPKLKSEQAKTRRF